MVIAMVMMIDRRAEYTENCKLTGPYCACTARSLSANLRLVAALNFHRQPTLASRGPGTLANGWKKTS